jgi:hypothetical protein
MEDDQKLWRYMSFSRFLWMIQRKQLWLSRTDKLEDPWELAVTGDEITRLMLRAPSPSSTEPNSETPAERTKRITELWRTTTFVNCWCALNYESHALWRVFCGPKEGVAITTNWATLTATAENIPVVEVDYTRYGGQVRTPTLEKVSIRKRQMYDYEHEVRLIAHSDTPNPRLIQGEFGFQLPFEPRDLVLGIVVHPEADESFYEVVGAAVDTYAADIISRIQWSTMKEAPPVVIVGPPA